MSPYDLPTGCGLSWAKIGKATVSVKRQIVAFFNSHFVFSCRKMPSRQDLKEMIARLPANLFVVFLLVGLYKPMRDESSIPS
jgi:hypothetical protein